MTSKPKTRASNPDGMLTDDGEVIRKLLPKLRQRALRDVKGTVRTWSVGELEQSIHYSKAAIRKAIKALKDQADADIFFQRDCVRLNGPRRINYREIFRFGAVPCTPLAKNFRRHGVLLKTQLRPPTSWSRLTQPSLTGGKEELVLTLHQHLMSTVNGQTKYSSFKVKETDWETLPATKTRRDRIRHAIATNDSLVRVIQVTTQKDSEGIHKIVTSELDIYYWRVDRIDTASGRFSATRTDSKVKTVPLSATESW